MAINFPDSPNLNDTHTPAGAQYTYRWDGEKWVVDNTIDSDGDLISNDGTRNYRIGIGTDGQLLVSRPGNGAGLKLVWEDVNASGFSAGDRVVMGQNTAPVGWTIVTGSAYSNAAIRLATSSGAADGGSVAFTTTFGTGKATDNHKLTVTEMPSHNHGVVGTFKLPTNWGVSGNEINASNHYSFGPTASGSSVPNRTFSSKGGNGNHKHTLTNMNVKYKTCVVCSYDG